MLPVIFPRKVVQCVLTQTTPATFCNIPKQTHKRQPDKIKALIYFQAGRQECYFLVRIQVVAMKTSRFVLGAMLSHSDSRSSVPPTYHSHVSQAYECYVSTVFILCK